MAVPIAIRLISWGRGYPWAVDALLALPFALDSAGNVLNLYHAWDYYDTFNHGFSWFDLAALAALMPQVRSLLTWARMAMTLGAGALGAVIWELGEFAAFIHTSYTRSAYADTLTDLTAGLIGSASAALLALLVTRWAVGEAVPARAVP